MTQRYRVGVRVNPGREPLIPESIQEYHLTHSQLYGLLAVITSFDPMLQNFTIQKYFAPSILVPEMWISVVDDLPLKGYLLESADEIHDPYRRADEIERDDLARYVFVVQDLAPRYPYRGRYSIYQSPNLEFLQGIMTAAGWYGVPWENMVVKIYDRGQEMEIVR